MDLAALPTPLVLVDLPRLEANLRGMQEACDRHGVELRPHIKTHKMVEVARRQLALGAKGLTCAKLGEAEAMLPAGPRSLFVAHSLVDPGQARRVAALAEQVDDFRVAVTSEAHAAALARVAAAAGRKLAVMLAIDTGLGREGTRGAEAADRAAAAIARTGRLELRGCYTHEGHFYGVPPAELAARSAELVDRLAVIRDRLDPKLALWPGCSVSARLVAAAGAGRVQAVRPGAYVFGDLSLARTTGVMRPDEVALHVLATVVDKPEPGLALIDAGSKTFSSDKTPDGLSAIATDGRDVAVARVNEEHGYLRGGAVDALELGERILLTPAHVCTVVNLTDEVVVTAPGRPVTRWSVEARGCTH